MRMCALMVGATILSQLAMAFYPLSVGLRSRAPPGETGAGPSWLVHRQGLEP